MPELASQGGEVTQPDKLEVRGRGERQATYKGRKLRLASGFLQQQMYQIPTEGHLQT